MNNYGAALDRRFLGQTQDQNLQQMIDIQKRINALADSVPPGTISKEQLDSVTKRLEQCRASAGTPQGVQCALQAEAEFKALVEAHRPSAPSVWPWVVGGAAAIGIAALLLSSGGRRR
jgi:hypothetical protein